MRIFFATAWTALLCLTLGFAGVMILTSVTFARRPVQMLAILISVTAAFIVICTRTTRGCWRWRWGDED